MNLTDRQKQLVELITAGLTTKEIAAKLSYSESTVKREKSVILARTGAVSFIEVIASEMRKQHSQRQQCIANCKSTADMEFYEKVARFGNLKLGHMWDFTTDDIFRAIRALILYVIEHGTIPERYSGEQRKELQEVSYAEICLKEGDGTVTIITSNT